MGSVHHSDRHARGSFFLHAGCLFYTPNVYTAIAVSFLCIECWIVWTPFCLHVCLFKWNSIDSYDLTGLQMSLFSGGGWSWMSFGVVWQQRAASPHSPTACTVRLAAWKGTLDGIRALPVSVCLGFVWVLTQWSSVKSDNLSAVSCIQMQTGQRKADIFMWRFERGSYKHTIDFRVV